MSLTEKRKKHKIVTEKRKKHKVDKPRTHQKIRKILQKKKREKQFKEAYPIEQPKGDLTVSASECALKLTGLPYSTTEEEIREWFTKDEIKIEDVHVCGKVRGTGIAYVTVKKEKAMRLGLAKNKQHLGERYINVELKPKTEMAEVLQLADMMDNAVFLRGLPFEVYRLDILRFFEGMSIAPRGIHLKNKGFAIVEFTDSQTAEEALKKNNEYIRDRYIKVFPCRMKDLVSMRDQIFAEKKKPVEDDKTAKMAESTKEETKEEEVEAESSGEEDKENGMEVEEEGDKEQEEGASEQEEEGDKEQEEGASEQNGGEESDGDEKQGESENEEMPDPEQKPKTRKQKAVEKLVDDKFSPRRLRSRTGTPKKTPPAKRLGRPRKSKK